MPKLYAFWLCATALAFLPGLGQPGSAPRDVLLMLGAPLVLAGSVGSMRVLPPRGLLALFTVPVAAAMLGIWVAPDPARAAVVRDAAWLLAGWSAALAVSLYPRADAAGSDLDDWLELGAVVAVGSIGTIGLLQAWIGWEGIAQARPPAATFVNRNVAAQTVLPLVALSWPLFFSSRSRGSWRVWAPWLAAFSTGTGLALVVAIRSRGAWLALVTSVLVGLVLAFVTCRHGTLERPPRLPLTMALVLPLAALFLPVAGQTSIKSSTLDTLESLARPMSGSSVIRTALWRNTAVMAGDFPLLGIGPGRFEAEYPRYQAAVVPTPGFGLELHPQHAHSDLLEFAAELGSPAACSLAGLLLASLWLAGTGALRSTAASVRRRDIARMMALTAILTHAAVSFPLHSPASALVAWLIVGRCWASSGRRMGRGSRAAVAFALVAAGLTLIAGWVGWREIRAETRLAVAVGEARSGSCDPDLRAASEARRLAPWRRRVVGLAAMTAFECDGDPERSLQVLEPALAMQPHQLNLLLAVGARRLKAGRTDAARVTFLHAVEVAPAVERGWLGLAMARRAAGDDEGADLACRTALSLAPEWPAARTFCRGAR